MLDFSRGRYTYDSCDTGILKGQKYVNGTGPAGAIHSRAPFAYKGKISSLPGMRASSCTCAGEDHPGPGVNVGRGAAEVDVFEMQVQEGHTYASQSAQVAPYDKEYYAGNSSTQMHIYNTSTSTINSYHGGPYQESVSVVTRVPDDNFERTGNRFVRYGMEYSPDWDGNGKGYIQWWIDGSPIWRMDASALAPQKSMDIGQRLVPTEPMSIVLNLGCVILFLRLPLLLSAFESLAESRVLVLRASCWRRAPPRIKYLLRTEKCETKKKAPERRELLLLSTWILTQHLCPLPRHLFAPHIRAAVYPRDSSGSIGVARTDR